MKWKWAIQLIALALILTLSAILFPPLTQLFSSIYQGFSKTFQVFIDLTGIAVIAFIFAALLAPLEALGWWAGWYGDPIKTSDLGTPENPQKPPTQITRYIIYLDGISQASSQYLADVEEFLRQLDGTLPADTCIIRGLMPYSVLNLPLTQKRVLSFLWRKLEEFRLTDQGGQIGDIIGFLINLRNLIIVAVSADQRYGAIYNQGTAQVMYNSLIDQGYQPGSGVPITLIGYSGGGQIAAGSAPFLKQALNAPIDIISIGGVIAGNNNFFALEHLYHLVGDQDTIEPLGAILFPRRWKLFFMSPWNRAKRLGKINFFHLGPMDHDGPDGPLDEEKRLPNGRTYLCQTIAMVTKLIQGQPLEEGVIPWQQQNNYERYLQADFNQLSFYPLNQSVDPQYYQPIANWMGRLILPSIHQRTQLKGILFEVHHAPEPYQNWVGKVVKLSWNNHPQIQSYIKTVAHDVHFSDRAKRSHQQGKIHPVRLNHWRRVDPLESLAGSRRQDDILVKLSEPVKIENPETDFPTLLINHEPVQITGRFYGLVKILSPLEPNGDLFRVIHYNCPSQRFDGDEEVVRIPQVIANEDGNFPSSNQGLEQSHLNQIGWYIYGAKDQNGVFVVQAIAPRSLFQLQPDQILVGKTESIHYIKKQAWQKSEVLKGDLKTTLLCPDLETKENWQHDWKEGDSALVLHVYGGVGGKNPEPATQSLLYFGHFAYGIAQVIREPLTDELRFDLEYYQVYTHNKDGIIAGTLHWSKYMGDRQFGWLGIRSVCDLLIKLDAFTTPFPFPEKNTSALDVFRRHLEIMNARYRIGDGTGGTAVIPTNNCVQDSNQALYETLQFIQKESLSDLKQFREQLNTNWNYAQLMQLQQSLKHKILPLENARPDWKQQSFTIALNLDDNPLQNLVKALLNWRSLLPRLTNDSVAQVFIEQGASVWVLRTNLIGGVTSDLEPVTPLDF